MTPAARIQAAIESLEALRSRVGTPAPGPEDPQLIKALHRAIVAFRSTIDAQLAILRDERSRLAHSCPHCTKPWAPAIALADAILGDPTQPH